MDEPIRQIGRVRLDETYFLDNGVLSGRPVLHFV